MKTSAALVAAAVALTASHALADGDAPKAVDAAVEKIAPPHVFVQFGGGASFSSVDAGDVHYISEHAHFDLAVGRELLVTTLANNDRIAFGVGYVGSVDVNSDEMLQRHGVGVTLRKSWFFGTLSGGVSFLYGFQDAAFAAGGHIGITPGFRIGPVQIALPIYVDIFSLPVTTFGATLGFQI